MNELPPNYENKDQLPLFGLVYCEAETEYKYLLAGIEISRQSRPRWEEPGPVQGHAVKSSQSYVWLGVQPPAEQAAAA